MFKINKIYVIFFELLMIFFYCFSHKTVLSLAIEKKKIGLIKLLFSNSRVNPNVIFIFKSFF